MEGATFADNGPGEDVEARRKQYTYALISEIRLLVRTVSNDPSKRVSDLKLSYKLTGESYARELYASEIIDEISDAEARVDQQLGIANIGFLQLVRDALVSMTEPATGLTIAYTTLVAGEQRSQTAESGFALAGKAYGLLLRRAMWHRRIAYILTAVAIAFTFFAAWEATKASLGKSLLQNLDLLQSQQGVISAEKLKLENILDKSAGNTGLHGNTDGPIPLQAVPLCDRYRLREAMAPNPPGDLKDLRLEASPAERELCGRDTILVRNLEIAHFNLQQYQLFWPEFAGGIIASTGRLLGRSSLFQHASSGPGCLHAASQGSNASSTCGDTEFLVAPSLQVVTNFVLPLTFGFLGSLLFVLLDHSTKLRANTLSPRDFPLMALRLIIGLVVAACVSLLISSSASPGAAAGGSTGGVPAAGALVASLISSASGITFLAGFGAEAVVTLLQSLVTRVFATPKP